MRDSIQAHNDYAENVLPKLKRAYLKKCQDVEVEVSRISSRAVVRSRLINRRITNRSPSRRHLKQNQTSVRPNPRVNTTVTPQRGQLSPRRNL